VPWLRIDDGFPEHPKLLALGDHRHRWTWLEVLAYCARRQTQGIVPPGIRDVIPKATPTFIQRCIEVGLLDQEDATLRVHDWAIYNGGTIDERVFAYLDVWPDASANEIQKATGGKRTTVLAAIQQYRSQSQNSGSPLVPPSVPLAGARGPQPQRDPHGSLSEELQPQLATPDASGTADAAPASRRSTGNARKPSDDSAAIEEVVKTYHRDKAERWVRNTGYLDPHPAEAIRAEFPTIPDHDLYDLSLLADELARSLTS
jgi:hypothetical protein